MSGYNYFSIPKSRKPLSKKGHFINPILTKSFRFNRLKEVVFFLPKNLRKEYLAPNRARQRFYKLSKTHPKRTVRGAAKVVA